jgi:hypothetical protein
VRITIKRLALGAAALTAASSVAFATGTPSYASATLATCPNGHICFYKDFNYLGNGQYTPAGTMSDQTATLFKGATTFVGNWHHGEIETIPTYGKISNMQNSHYTNGEGLNDSISLVVNNSNECLAMFPDANFLVENNIYNGNNGTTITEFAPHTSKAMAGNVLGRNNDGYSSAATVPRGDSRCVNVPVGHYYNDGGWGIAPAPGIY